MNARQLTRFKRLLVDEESRILAHSNHQFAGDISISPEDLSDEADLAANEINHNLVFKLKDRERMMLAKIKAALKRIDSGDFGLCEECEESIEPKRLEVRPFSTHCLECKERREHLERFFA